MTGKLLPKSTRDRIVMGLLVVLLMATPVIILKRSAIRGFIKELPWMRERLRIKTLDEQIQVYGASARERLKPKFESAKAVYPPDKVALVAIKDSLQLHVYAAQEKQPYRYICSYPILGASGFLGPKLREGDMQVPEGIYQLALEPNTPYHLALRLNYPNEYDQKRAAEDGRNPGRDILIHGTTGSVGCMAMGDQGSEDLFVLVYDAHDRNVLLVIAPVDFRVAPAPKPKPTDPEWLPDLYSRIKDALAEFAEPPRK